jgi:hypothetical protein
MFYGANSDSFPAANSTRVETFSTRDWYVKRPRSAGVIVAAVSPNPLPHSRSENPMLRPVVLLLSVVVSPALAPVARAAGEPKDVIAKAVKAHGGEEFLTKHQAGQSKNKGKIDIPGVGAAEFTQETAYMLPDKFKDAMELKIANQTVNILTLVNGDKTVIEVNGTAVDIPDGAKAALKDVGHVLKVGRLVPLLKDKGYELNIIGDDKVEGKEVVGVRVSAKGQKDVSLYFDKKTNLLAKMAFRSVDATSGNETDEERIVTEYQKSKDGVQTPKKVLVKRDGKELLQAEVVEMQYLEKLDDGEFKK